MNFLETDGAVICESIENELHAHLKLPWCDNERVLHMRSAGRNANIFEFKVALKALKCPYNYVKLLWVQRHQGCVEVDKELYRWFYKLGLYSFWLKLGQSEDCSLCREGTEPLRLYVDCELVFRSPHFPWSRLGNRSAPRCPADRISLTFWRSNPRISLDGG